MPTKIQVTNLQRNFGQALVLLAKWAENPWRRYSLFLITLLTGFVLGSAIGTINGVLALMDPLGAFLTVILLELMVRLRRYLPASKGSRIAVQVMDVARFGLLYGLILEGFKLL